MKHGQYNKSSDFENIQFDHSSNPIIVMFLWKLCTMCFTFFVVMVYSPYLLTTHFESSIPTHESGIHFMANRLPFLGVLAVKGLTTATDPPVPYPLSVIGVFITFPSSGLSTQPFYQTITILFTYLRSEGDLNRRGFLPPSISMSRSVAPKLPIRAPHNLHLGRYA
ncbi:hypothetical protein J1N35_024965 [Gossypium stocksii]|uniref:Uncharacterized protein n=1 Tax=Gossypium stocksii TaxID=47602 RepID=A0A9D3V5N8_9ROSI|nr:hypothetical protein J1N35_024965 [Gossypium stocksii]